MPILSAHLHIGLIRRKKCLRCDFSVSVVCFFVKFLINRMMQHHQTGRPVAGPSGSGAVINRSKAVKGRPDESSATRMAATGAAAAGSATTSGPDHHHHHNNNNTIKTGSSAAAAAAAAAINEFKTKTVLKEAVDAVVSSFAKHSQGYGRGKPTWFSILDNRLSSYYPNARSSGISLYPIILPTKKKIVRGYK